MSAEEILITDHGYTSMAYASCGDVHCTEAVLRAVGVKDRVLEARGIDLSEEEIAEGVLVTVALLGESDSCEWCARCGDFIRHGLRYSGEDIGCTHPEGEGGWVIDPEPQDGPHPDLKNHPAIKEWWGAES